MLWWNWRILSNFQSGGLTEIYAGMLSLLPSIGRKSARSAAKVIAPRGKKPAVEISILHTFGFGGSRDHIRECDSTPAQAMPKYFCSKTRISRRFEIRRGPRKVYVGPCTPDRHVFRGSLKIVKFRQCYLRTHQDFRGSNSTPTRVFSARLTKNFSVFSIR